MTRVSHKARADYLTAKIDEALRAVEERRVGSAKVILRIALARHQPKGARGIRA